MSAMPSKAALHAALSQTFLLEDEHGTTVDAQLSSVDDGTPMSGGYACYSAVFVLPPGVSATQGTFRVGLRSDTWPLFMTAIGCDAAGRARLEALFHYRDSGTAP